MEFDIAIIGITVTIIIALLSLAYNAGVLSTKVRLQKEEFEHLWKENREDHKAINSKLDALLKNGR